MKFDNYGVLIREAPRPEGKEFANLGDSAADTCRAYILGQRWMADPFDPAMMFSAPGKAGFLRHPDLADRKDWNAPDFTNDQLIPLMMAQDLYWGMRSHKIKWLSGPFIKGTWKLAQPAVYAILWRQWWLLDIMNRIQGRLLGLSFRWSDDKSEGTGFRSSAGKVQDYPTMICTTVFLNRIGYKAKLPRPAIECMAAIVKYRQDPADFEPNAEWEIELYRHAILELEPGPPDNFTHINTKDAGQLHGV